MSIRSGGRDKRAERNQARGSQMGELATLLRAIVDMRKPVSVSVFVRQSLGILLSAPAEETDQSGSGVLRRGTTRDRPQVVLPRGPRSLPGTTRDLHVEAVLTRHAGRISRASACVRPSVR